MDKIVFKKSWVKRLDDMHRVQREKCIIALYDFLFHGRMTPPCFMGEEVRTFMRSIADEVALDAERRERMAKRREAKKARVEREAREREMQAQQAAEQEQVETPQPETTTSTQTIFKSIDYTAHPEMFIIEGFIKYLIATGDTQLTSILPKGTTLPSLEHSLNHCFSTGQRYSNITRFVSTLRSQLRHTLKQCLNAGIIKKISGYTNVFIPGRQE
ncbi:MAG: hypothetical protein K2K27_06030 [Muribaculaceae bacterium]|nr:hypothetical protein [Muribaculaceae bacterium]MDE7092784.1 hypothetical protein [Muribaculaceae bacterium]